MNGADQEMRQRIATLESEFRHMARELERSQAECDRRVEKQQELLDAHAKRLTAYDNMAIKGGSFALGFLALGVLMSEQVEKFVRKLTGLVP